MLEVFQAQVVDVFTEAGESSALDGLRNGSFFFIKCLGKLAYGVFFVGIYAGLFQVCVYGSKQGERGEIRFVMDGQGVLIGRRNDEDMVGKRILLKQVEGGEKQDERHSRDAEQVEYKFVDIQGKRDVYAQKQEHESDEQVHVAVDLPESPFGCKGIDEINKRQQDGNQEDSDS